MLIIRPADGAERGLAAGGLSADADVLVACDGPDALGFVVYLLAGEGVTVLSLGGLSSGAASPAADPTVLDGLLRAALNDARRRGAKTARLPGNRDPVSLDEFFGRPCKS